jgi:hypothetical protein
VTHRFSKKCSRRPCSSQKAREDEKGNIGKWATIFWGRQGSQTSESTTAKYQFQKNENFEIATATTPEEIKKLGQSVLLSMMNLTVCHFYRKPKNWWFTVE